MAQETNQSQAPLLCTTGCGFYGNPRKNGMCSVCYKDFLQRQNGNVRVSLPESSTADSSIGEAVLAQCSDTVPVPTVASHTDTESQSSSVSLDSEEDCTSGTEGSLKTDDLQGSVAAAVVASVQEDQDSAAGSSEARLSSRLERRPSLGQCTHKGKRKLEDTGESLNAKQAKVSEDLVQTAVKSEEKPKAKKNRCSTCRKKIGLTGFNCRCGNVFCSVHRYSDVHNCTFDYKADAAEKIRKENPAVVGEKIQKI